MCIRDSTYIDLSTIKKGDMPGQVIIEKHNRYKEVLNKAAPVSYTHLRKDPRSLCHRRERRTPRLRPRHRRHRRHVRRTDHLLSLIHIL